MEKIYEFEAERQSGPLWRRWRMGAATGEIEGRFHAKPSRLPEDLAC